MHFDEQGFEKEPSACSQMPGVACCSASKAAFLAAWKDIAGFALDVDATLAARLRALRNSVAFSVCTSSPLALINVVLQLIAQGMLAKIFAKQGVHIVQMLLGASPKLTSWCWGHHEGSQRVITQGRVGLYFQVSSNPPPEVG